jgi:hypothetical protein
MKTNFWVKTTNFKLFGKVFFTREEICNDKEYDGDIIEVQVPKDYYKFEFDMKNEKKN